ncbi:MAG: AAA family ATPase [Altererythrobacter sp.]|jgi:AAA domain (dynein-related subfamily)|nr:AAA family ATPase [Altererythrobacter sp.]
MNVMQKEISLNEAADLIMSVGGDTTVHLVGEPGIGKTAMFERIVKATGFRGVYIDTPNTELGDIGIPMPNHETKTTTLYPNEHWGFHTGEPLVIFIDEFTKPSSQAVQNMLHPLLNERRIGGFKQHKDTIVITAGNNVTDGVGDVMKSHSLNRISVAPVKKPHAGWNADNTVDPDSWGAWAMHNDVAPEVLAWVKAYPHCLASYMDASQAENPYIFQPKFPQRSFVSPRSLVRASHIVKQRDKITRNALSVALAGTIGHSAAADMTAYIDVADTLPTWAEVVADPEGAKLPSSAAALTIMAYGALQRVDRSTIGPWFEYLKRTPKELQSVFCISAARHPEKKQILMTSAAFVTWMRNNQYLF